MGFARCDSWLLSGVAVVFVLSGAAPVRAEPSDADASKLRTAAVYEDYLATRFDEAEAKLLKAVALCSGARACSSVTRARLHCDLAVIDFALDKPDDGRAEFAEAVKHDASVTIDHDLSSPALEEEFVASGGHGPAAVVARASQNDSSGPSRKGSDCPPGFPGCVETDVDAEMDQAPQAPPHRQNWISVAVHVDALWLPSANDVCAGGSGYACYGDGTYYGARPLAGADDVVRGGLRLGTTRLLVGYDRAVSGNVTVGLKVGYALGGGPGRPGGRSFDPLHLETRATYWWGHDALGRSGLRPFATASLGTAEIDASVPADVYSSPTAYRAGQSQTYAAWRKTGLGFVALGAGAMLALTPDGGPLLEIKGIETFPTLGTSVALELGYAVGF